MARKGGSFQFAKRQKDLKKQKKRQEKLERKRLRAEAKAAGLDPDLIVMPGDEPEESDDAAGGEAEDSTESDAAPEG